MFGKKSDQVDLECFVFFDTKVGAYRQPYFAVNRDVLLRSMVNEFRDPKYQNTEMFLNAEDFSIYLIGTYAFKEGVIKPVKPEHVINVVEVRTMAMRSPTRQQEPSAAAIEQFRSAMETKVVQEEVAKAGLGH